MIKTKEVVITNRTVLLGSDITINLTKSKVSNLNYRASRYPELTCRVCLQAGDIPIFGDASHSDISRDVRTFGCVAMDECDGLPRYLCNDCFALLEAAKSFREKAQSSDGMLRTVRWCFDACEEVDKTSDKQHTLLEKVGESNNDSSNSIHETVKPADLKKVKALTMKNMYYVVKKNNVKATAKSSNRNLKLVGKSNPIKNYSKTSGRQHTDLENDCASKEDVSNLRQPDTVEFSQVTDRKININEQIIQSDVIIKYENCNEDEMQNIFNDNSADVSEILLETTPKMYSQTTVKCEGWKLLEKDKSNNEGQINKSRRCDKQHMGSDNDFKSNKVNKLLKAETVKFTPDTDEHIQSDVIIKVENCNEDEIKTIFNDSSEDVSKIPLEMTPKLYSQSTEESQVIYIKEESAGPPIDLQHRAKSKALTIKKKRVSKNKVVKPTVKGKRSMKSEEKDNSKPKKSQIKIFVCDKCGFVAQYQATFKEHYLLHSNELPFQCDVCPYRGRSLSALRIHKRSHAEPRYKCPECPARCTTAANLNRHKRQHTGPGKFICETCKRHFYTKLELERHVLAVHLEHRPFECDICGKDFGFRKSLTRHRKKVHKLRAIKGGRLPLYIIFDQTKSKEKKCA